MKARATPRLIPDSSAYVCVNLGDQGDHHFRVPSVLAGAKLLQAVDPDALGALAALASVDLTDPASLVAAVRGSGPELIGLAGYAVGIAWFHVERDLETPIDPSRPLETGEAVVEELHEHGLDLAALVQCASIVLGEWVRRNSVSAEVASRADFFSPTRGGRSSSTSTSASPSSATPGGSDA